MQDIIVMIKLDTKPIPRETLLPLLLSSEGEKPYAEYTSLDKLALDYPNTTETYACAARLFGQQDLAEGSIAKCAVLGVAPDADDAGVIDALNALREEQDDWYFLLPVNATDERILALAAWTEQTLLSEVEIRSGEVEAEKLLIAQTSNKSFVCENHLAAVVYNADAAAYNHAAWVGRVAPSFPNAVTWKWKELVGIKPISLKGKALHELLESNLNAYIRNNKRNYMSEGICCDSEFIDTVIARWQIKQMLRGGLTDYLVDHEVVPYDNDGFSQIGKVVFETLNRAVGYGIILSGFELLIPRREDATRDQAARRIMPPIKWRATLRGGVHGVDIGGTLTVDLVGGDSTETST